MKEVLYFYMNGCPHCRKADILIEKLKSANPNYAEIIFKKVEENDQPELANSYNYYYVPSFFIEDKKLHEGHVEKSDIQAILEEALK